MFLDIFSLRNVAPASDNVFKSVNAYYRKTTKAVQLPFSTCYFSENTNTFLIDLILLPHQYFVMPMAYETLLKIGDNVEVEVIEFK